MKIQRIGFWITGLIFLVFVLASCAAPAVTAPQPTSAADTAVEAATVPATVPTVANPAALGPAETVAEFYKWYLAYTDGGQGSIRNPLVNGAYRDTGYLTREFAEQVAAAVSGHTSGGFDPFLCAQDIPSEVIPVDVRESGDGAAVDVRTSFEGHRFTVGLQRAGDRWQIFGVICETGEATAQATPSEARATVEVTGERARSDAQSLPEGWQLYRNDLYRFQVGYPQGWTVRETAAAEGEPPIGPENMKLVVMLMPEEWAAQLDGTGAPDPNAPVLAPFTLDVTVGTEAAFWVNYPQPLEREAVSVAHADGTRAIEVMSDEITIPHLVFQHPVARDVRVTLTDPINGFADRRAAYPDVAAAFEKVADTFAWLD